MEEDQMLPKVRILRFIGKVCQHLPLASAQYFTDVTQWEFQMKESMRGTGDFTTVVHDGMADAQKE